MLLEEAPRVSEGMKRGMSERLSEEGLKEGETSKLEPGASSELGDLGCLVANNKRKEGNII